ncbi:MAG: hypothetical protein SGARI_004482, partial [Bacillariaceae sp.]
SAVYWYERAVSSSLKRLELEGDNSKHAKNQLARHYNDLAVATKRAGKLVEAQGHYDTALRYVGLGKVKDGDLKIESLLKAHHDTDLDYNERTKATIDINRVALINELKEWTGNSERLTPGC